MRVCCSAIEQSLCFGMPIMTYSLAGSVKGERLVILFLEKLWIILLPFPKVVGSSFPIADDTDGAVSSQRMAR